MADFTDMLPRLKKSNLEHELILRAIRIREKKTLRILDATAGMGEDALYKDAPASDLMEYMGKLVAADEKIADYKEDLNAASAKEESEKPEEAAPVSDEDPDPESVDHIDETV